MGKYSQQSEHAVPGARLDMSFATLEYLKRHDLLDGDDSTQFLDREKIQRLPKLR